MPKLLIVLLLLSSAVLQSQQPINPAALGSGSITTDGASSRNNTVGVGMTVAGVFDDNATNPMNTAQALSDYRFSVQPQLSLDLERSRSSSVLSYSPGYTYSSKISAYNSASHAASADVRYELSKRLSLHFINEFCLSTSAYDSFKASAELSSIGILNRPNASVVGTNIRSTTEQSQLDVAYQLGRHTSVGIGGRVADLNYQTPTLSVPDNSVLQHSRGWTGNAFYSQQLTARYSFGIQYSAETLNSQAPTGLFSLLSHQVIGFLNVTLNPVVSFSVFLGPEFANLDNSYVPLVFTSHSTRKSLTGGGIFNVRGKRNGLSASFVQQISDSGLNGAGSLLVRTAQVQLKHQIANRVTLNTFGTYISNNQLDPLSPVLLADSASAGVTFTKSITPRISVNISGMRQQIIGTPGQALSQFAQHSHDVATVSLSYTFVRPIGR
ncbi:MAG: hypothetical protein ACJ71Q_02670 [Terriglobales bacterium]|jgi:hypothetical protein